MDTQLSLSRQTLPSQHIHQHQIPQPQIHDSTTTFPTSYSTPTPYPSASEDEASQPQSHSHSHTTSSTSSSSTTSPSGIFWPLPAHDDQTRAEADPEASQQRAGPQNGPSASDVGAGRPARRVKHCGVGPSRHGPYKATLMEIRCWDHGCEGRKFSSLGNYRRHLREKNGQAKVYPCPDCGRVFTRSTARNFHRESGTCGLSPRQLMLQMQMQMQAQMQSQLLYPSSSSFNNLSSPMVYDSYVGVDWNVPMDLYSAPGVVLWGGTNGR